MNLNRLKRFIPKLTTGQLALLITLVVIAIDQIVKIWIKTDFYLGESREITPWFSLTFVENNGMAFGWQFGSKLFLTLFRIIFVGVLIHLMIKSRKNTAIKRGFMVCMALVLAGALGNIIDCVFYGVAFNNPMPPETAQLFPDGGGYASLLNGRVVDMLSFHLFSFDWPQWLPLIGGKHFDFFQPIFNIADAAISVGIIAIILFYSKQINLLFPKKAENSQLQQPDDEAK